jgi:hypothetical protein
MVDQVFFDNENLRFLRTFRRLAILHRLELVYQNDNNFRESDEGTSLSFFGTESVLNPLEQIVTLDGILHGKVS